MTKQARLTDTHIVNAKPEATPYKLTDGSGLFLLVSPTGKKLWRYRYRLSGKENVFALGEYVKPPNNESPATKALRLGARQFSLAEAREQRKEAERIVRGGLHPKEFRDEQKQLAAEKRDNTVEAVARKFIETKKNWKPATRRQRIRALEMYVFPVLGKTPVTEVPRPRINKLLEEIGRSAPQTAILIRQLFEAIFDYAEHIGLVEQSVALRLISIETEPTRHHRKLSPEDIGPFLKAVDDYPGTFETRTALQLLAQTLVRPTEAIEAEWCEFDFEKKLWSIPTERMKMNKPHLVPLSRQTIELLKALQGVTGKSKFLFPNRSNKSKPASKGILGKLITSIGWNEKITPHGWRGTGSTILYESGLFIGDAIERQLAHVERNQVKAAYNAAEHMNMRREMLQWWADLLDKSVVDCRTNQSA